MILDTLGRVPVVGESVQGQGYRFICEEVTRTAILRGRIVATRE